MNLKKKVEIYIFWWENNVEWKGFLFRSSSDFRDMIVMIYPRGGQSPMALTLNYTFSDDRPQFTQY